MDAEARPTNTRNDLTALPTREVPALDVSNQTRANWRKLGALGALDAEARPSGVHSNRRSTPSVDLPALNVAPTTRANWRKLGALAEFHYSALLGNELRVITMQVAEWLFAVT